MITAGTLPLIIQGGMGVGVSGWRLARAVSASGQLGVVSGTALDTTLARHLQDGDPGGHLRRAMNAFPLQRVSQAALRLYFREGGRAAGEPYRLVPMYRQNVSIARQQLTVLANFVEVFLAKEGHHGVVGINLLTKLQLPNLASLYGAMLAGVDYVLMGAGIPREIPAALDALSENKIAVLRFDVVGQSSDQPLFISFDPIAVLDGHCTVALKRPRFLAIVAAHSLATTLARKSTGRIDGFVVEGPTAGGHNAPARGEAKLNELGEPIYGERDVVDLEKIRELGIPFWMAGGTGSPGELQLALSEGAAGIQTGTLFAYCDESGFDNALKHSVLEGVKRCEVTVKTDPRASPTGFPFKIVEWPEHENGERLARLCDLGYLRSAYAQPSGGIGYRCPAEPVADYVRKGGDIEDTVGRKCVCNGLVAAIGLPQTRQAGELEPALVTSGNALLEIGDFLGSREHYSATEVLDYLLGGLH
ncbi:MAG: nitronate monooxygenase [Gemmatimonadaceae bacterium]